DVAYNQIPRSARLDLHVKAAGWMQAREQSDDQVEMLAHHYLSALELGRITNRDVGHLRVAARAALRAAGDRALSLSALAAAAQYFDAALGLCAEDEPEERAELTYRLARAQGDVGDDPGSELLAEAARQL